MQIIHTQPQPVINKSLLISLLGLKIGDFSQGVTGSHDSGTRRPMPRFDAPCMFLIACGDVLSAIFEKLCL
jgi:hypothetical protein